MKIVKSSRKAISPLLATIILIAITIVGGLVVYSIFTSSAGAAGSQSSVQVVSAQLVVPTGSAQATFAITVKNSGNKPINNLQISGIQTGTTLCGTGGTNPSLVTSASSCAPAITLAPGQSAAGTMTITLPGNPQIIVGKTYQYVITATFVDGSTSTNVFTVQATSS
jgi:flagellin-like protein